MNKLSEMTPKKVSKLQSFSPIKQRLLEPIDTNREPKLKWNLERKDTDSTTITMPDQKGMSVSKEQIETLENKISVLE